MKPPRGLSDEESDAWARVAASVTPLHRPSGVGAEAQREAGAGAAKAVPSRAALLDRPAPVKAAPKQNVAVRPLPVAPPPRSDQDRSGLDGHWERKLRAGSLSPDFTLDLHEHSLDAAYNRLLGGIDIARETGARVILIIAGRERPTHAADRADKRGAIRAKLLDWLAASRHASAIAAIRKAHRRHGGEGALYLILKRDR